MELFIWLLCLTIGGSFAFNCDETERCDNAAIKELTDSPFVPPNAEQRSRLCPSLVEFFECYFAEVQKCTSFSVEELAATGHDTALQLMSGRNYLLGFCDEDSPLHNGYDQTQGGGPQDRKAQGTEGSFASQCGERCKDDTFREMVDLEFFPNKEQLTRLCPKFLQLFDCYFAEVEKYIKLSISELATTGYKFASELLVARNFAVDVCNETSTLHSDYISNIDCILDVTNTKYLYYEEARKLVINFSESKGRFENTGLDRETIMHTLFCLEYDFIITCLAQDINRNCGTRARVLYLTILELTDVNKPDGCSTENILSLKREFLDSLKLGEDTDNFWSIYRALQRR